MLEDIQASLWVCVRLSTVFCRARGVRNVSIWRNITFSWATRDSLSYTSCTSTILFSLELIRNSMRKKGWLIIIFFSFFSSQRNPYRQYVSISFFCSIWEYANMYYNKISKEISWRRSTYICVRYPTPSTLVFYRDADGISWEYAPLLSIQNMCMNGGCILLRVAHLLLLVSVVIFGCLRTIDMGWACISE